MNEQARIWIKELSGPELDSIPGLLANGYSVYVAAMDDSQGWRVKGIEMAENRFDDPSHVLLAEETHHPPMPVDPDAKTRFYIVGWPEPWTKQPRPVPLRVG